MDEIHKFCDMSPTYKHCNLDPCVIQILKFVGEENASMNHIDNNVNDNLQNLQVTVMSGCGPTPLTNLKSSRAV